MLMEKVVVAQPLAGLLSNDAPNLDLSSLPNFDILKLLMLVVVVAVAEIVKFQKNKYK